MTVLKKLFTKRALMVALIAGSGALVATSFAMPGGGNAGSPGKPGCVAGLSQPGQDQAQVQSRRGEYRAQRLAGLKEKLQLKPEQEAAWQTFAAAAQPGNGRLDRQDRQAMRESLQKLSTPERLDKMLAMADQRRARMLERSAAVKQFYAQLSPEQQGVFDAQAMPVGHGKHHRHGGHRHQS